MSTHVQCMGVEAALREADRDVARACAVVARDPKIASATALRAARLAASALVATARGDRCTSPWGRARDLGAALRRAAANLRLPPDAVCRGLADAKWARDECHALGPACPPDLGARGATAARRIAGWAREAARERRRRRVRAP